MMSDAAPSFVGVDVGGTKILALLVDAEGEILGRARAKTDPVAALDDQIAAVVDEVLAGAAVAPEQIGGIGLAVPGVVDSQTGRFVHAPNLQNADPELVRQLARRYPVPVVIGNDVNLGTLAEVWRGAGRDADCVVGVFVGTGIGGGVVIDGRLRVGPEDQAGEIGHLVLCVDGPECGCGNRGCFEALASRTAVERDLRQAIAQGRDSVLREKIMRGRVGSGALAEALAAGDELTIEVMTRLGHYLGQGALTLRHCLDPDLIIFGGGVIEACGDFLLPLIEAEVRADRLQRSRDVLRIVASQLGDDAVPLGAAALIRAHVMGESVAAAPKACPEPPAPAEPLPGYPRIEQVRFGAARVDGEEVPHDFYIRANGKLKERNKKPVRKRHGSSHVLDAEELAKVCKGEPQVVIIGAGFSNMVRLTEDAEQYLTSRGVSWQVLSTPKAAEAFNRAEGRKALFMHVTC